IVQFRFSTARLRSQYQTMAPRGRDIRGQHRNCAGAHRQQRAAVWKAGIEITKVVFQLTKTFPSEEKYGLISQMIRSAISIPSNIAEGCGRKSNKELHQFLNIALGSSFELETQLIIAKEFN
ncbi:MAG: four helix bundle protein, partial [Mucilaginibacter sp.]